MKRLVCWILAVVLFTGCAEKDDALERAMAVRARLQAAEASFDAEIYADYGDMSYSFSVHCVGKTDGTMEFTVKEPQTISGITGWISAAEGKLTFEDTALAFGLMADGQLTPVSAPWVLMKSLRSGYLSACCREEGLLRLSIDDSYEEDALRAEIWLDEEELPKEAEIYWQGRRLLSISVSNFQLA